MAVVVSSWTGARPSPKSRLIDKLCRLYGYDSSDGDLRQVAIDALDDTIKDLNTRRYEFNRVVEQGIPLVEGQPWVLLTSNAHTLSQAYLVPNNGGDRTPMVGLPWTTFKRLYPNELELGRPEVYSTFNGDKDGRMYMWKVPNASVVSDYTLAVEYYHRIPLISELGDSDSLEIPQEIENAVVYGGEKRIAMHQHGPAHPDVGSLAALEQQALARLVQSDRYQPDQQFRFRLVDTAYRADYR